MTPLTMQALVGLAPAMAKGVRVLGWSLLGVALFMGGCQYGQTRVAGKAQAAKVSAGLVKAQTEVARAHVEAAQSQATVQVVTRYVDRVKVVTRRAADLRRKAPAYVRSPSSQPAADLPGGFRLLHDAAAAGADLPDAPGGADAAPVALDAAAETVVDNYATCSANAEQLTALQDWVRTQQEATK